MNGVAGAARLLVFLFSLVIAGTAFFSLPSPWAWLAALAVAGTGGLAAERVFRRLASSAERRADLQERVRNPPS